MQGKYLLRTYKVVAFRWKSPGAGTVTLSMCNQTNSNSAIEIFKSSDGRITASSMTKVMSIDDGCGAGSSASFGTLQGVTQGAWHWWMGCLLGKRVTPGQLTICLSQPAQCHVLFLFMPFVLRIRFLLHPYRILVHFRCEYPCCAGKQHPAAVLQSWLHIVRRLLGAAKPLSQRMWELPTTWAPVNVEAGCRHMLPSRWPAHIGATLAGWLQVWRHTR